MWVVHGTRIDRPLIGCALLQSFEQAVDFKCSWFGVLTIGGGCLFPCLVG